MENRTFILCLAVFAVLFTEKTTAQDGLSSPVRLLKIVEQSLARHQLAQVAGAVSELFDGHINGVQH